MPSFVARVERPERGGEWVRYLEGRERGGRRWAARLGLDRADEPDDRTVACACCTSTATRTACWPRCSSRPAGVSEEETREGVARLRAMARAQLLADLVGERATAATGRGAGSRRCATASRSSPTTARSATCSATACSPSSGSGSRPTSAPACPTRSTPPASATPTRRALRALAGGVRAAGRCRPARARRCTRCASASASATCSTSTRARRCTRSSCARGARATRATARSRTRCTRRSAAVHPAVAAAMTHVDHDTEPRLERILSEMRTEARLASR